jgi:hypothetical protein
VIFVEGREASRALLLVEVLSSSVPVHGISHSKMGSEELDKVTREGLNGSQLKFLERTWLLFQNRPNIPLF